MFSFTSNRSRLSQRKVGTWPRGSEPSATWSVLLRPRMVCGKCSRWPPGRRCRSAAARRTTDVWCCKMAITHGQFYPGAAIPRGTGLAGGMGGAFLGGAGREGGGKECSKWNGCWTDFTLGLGLAGEGRGVVGANTTWMTTAVNHWALHHPGGKLKPAKMLVCCAFQRGRYTDQDHKDVLGLSKIHWSNWDVAVTVFFCIYNTVQVPVLYPDELTGEWGPTDGTVRVPLSAATSGPGRVLWGRRRGGGIRLYTHNADKFWVWRTVCC